ncbi:MAG TPA: hypothetical protein VGD41_09365 [Pyrinomonadaceae bacterium]
MPTLDVSDAFDPSFWDEIKVRRRQQIISETGRVSTINSTFSMQAVVTPASPADLQRLTDYQHMGKAISIYSITPRLQGPAVVNGGETQPDQIEWHGSVYLVRLVEDWAGFGAGYVHTIAESIQSVDPPPPDVNVH